MTTTAATNSASPSTSNDSPLQDNVASEPTTNNVEQHPQQQQQQSSKQPQQANPEQKRPMNAFLLFCKRQRSLVREKYPKLENRSITRILGDWWSKLDKDQKDKYTDLARQHKEAFMKAHPDFKWCKTPMSNNNNNTNSNSNCNKIDNHATTNNSGHTTTLNMSSSTTSSESTTPISIDINQTANNSRDTLTINIKHQQNEAPKPPKKRFLERTDSIYAKNNSHSNNESTSQHVTRDGVVPFISFDQDTLNRVIDEAFSEKSESSPSGTKMCKLNNSNSTNSASSLGAANPSSFSASSTSSPSSYYNNVDEPVDFSMNRTINTTSQQIIDNLVDKMLGPADNDSIISKMNGTDSVTSQPIPSVKRESSEDL